MKNTDPELLALLRAGLHREKPADPGLPPEDWQELLRRAEAHMLLPVILDAACALPSCRAALRPSVGAGSPGPSSPVGAELEESRKYAHIGPSSPVGADAHIGPSSSVGAGSPGPSAPQKCHSERSEESASPVSAPDWKALVLEQVSRQVRQENEFLNLILALRERGLEPVVMKGCVCRALWPKPLLRPSVDDDLLIPPDQAPAFHAALLDLGLTPDNPAADPETAWELSWHKPSSPLYIELHKQLFAPESDALLGFNAPFDGALDRTVPVQIQDVTLRTLAPTDHLRFLLLHAFKHFLYSGFGLRIIADVCLFAQHYAADIDFDGLLALCVSLRCDRFAAALFRIGEKHLGLPAPAAFAAIEADETALLEDVLASGLVGADIDRLHSANITLGAVADRNNGRARSGGLRKVLFPSAPQLSDRYPWLRKRPWLLPAAWVSRMGSYLKDRGKHGAESPAASLRIGRARVELLKTYGIIDE